jgi:hypothetical protein
MKLLTYVLALLLMTIPVQAEQFAHWQGFDIHYNTFNSLLIPAEVAKAHGISRSENRVITNISIVRDGTPTTGIVEGYSLNLLGQLTQLDFTEVKESSGVYYLANQIVDEKDTLRFSIKIQPNGSEETFDLKYKRQYQ